MARAVVGIWVVALVAGFGGGGKGHVASTSTGLAEAEKLWTVAETESDPREAPAKWEAAARAFVAAVDAGTLAKAEEVDALVAAVDAWKNALDVEPRVKTTSPSDTVEDLAEHGPPTPRELDERDAALVHAFDLYLEKVPDGADAPGVAFLRANILRRFDHLAEATKQLQQILERYPKHEVAEYAATLLLDSLNRLERFDELVAQAEALRADTAFLADKPDLAKMVQAIHVQAGRKHAEAVEKDARTNGDLDTYDRCGEAYVALAGEKGVDADERDEIAYNAGVCFEAAGSTDRAVAEFRAVKTKGLKLRAVGRIAVIEGRRAHFPEAIAALRQYLGGTPPSEPGDWVEAASDGVWYARGIGDVKAVTWFADRMIAAVGKRRPHEVLEADLVVVETLLAAGQRKAAAKRARAMIARMTSPNDPWTAFRAGETIADAACPVALVDGLCAKRRAADLVAKARGLLQRAADASGQDAVPYAARYALDLDLEDAVAGRQKYKVTAMLDGYRAIAESDAAPPEERVAAHARLARWAHHDGDTDAERVELDACVRAARAAKVGDDWMRGCEQGLAALKAPVDTLPEKLGPATGSGIPADSVEGARLPASRP